MAGSMNKVTLIGNLGADPEVRTFSNGNKVCNLSIATTEKWRDKSTGENREKTEWHRVSIFGEGLIRVCEQYLRKGSSVYVEGKLQTRKWQDQSGNDRYSTDIVLQGFDGKMIMLDGRNSGGGQGGGGDYGGGQGGGGGQSGDYGGGNQGGGGGYGGGNQGGPQGGPPAAGGLDDEIPF